MIGSTLSHYKIIQKIGEGGMGIIYKAEDMHLQRHVALKVLPMLRHISEEDRRRFMQEAVLTSSLNHPNILIVHDFDVQDGVTFMVTEFVEGRSLETLLHGEHLSVELILDLACEAAAGIAEAHAHGIIHRDLKPDNIMISEKGQVKVMDFGLARLVGSSRVTTPGSIVGTFAYMSPEQINEHEIDSRSDIFAFGILLYQMTTGVLPFTGKTATEMLSSIVHKYPQPMNTFRGDVPKGLEQVILKALEKDPQVRYQSMDELRFDLDQLRADPLTEFKEQKKFNKKIVYTSAIVAAILFGIGIAALWRPSSSSTPPNKVKAIAVMPFVNMAGGEEASYLSIGLADDIITRLSFIRSLLVKPTSAVAEYEGKNVPAADAGKQLGADYVLEGRFRKVGDQLRVNAQLVDVEGGAIRWAKEINLRWQALLSIQDSVSYAIVNDLQLQLSEAEQSNVHKVRTANPAAYEAYLRGVSFRVRGSRENNLNAASMFEQSIRLDSNFAEAHANLAFVYVDRFWDGYSADTSWVTQGEIMSRKAIHLDDHSAISHAALSFALRIKGKYHEAMQEVIKTLNLDPHFSFSLDDISEFYRNRGDFAKALIYAERAAESDPTFNINRVRARIYQFQGNYKESITEIERAILRNPADAWFRGGLLAQSYIHLHEIARAENAIRQADSLDANKPETRISRAMAAALKGDNITARRELTEVKDFIERDYGLAFYPAVIYAKLQDTAKALESVRNAIDLGNRFYSWYLSEEWLAPLRNDPRFIQMIATMRKESDDIALELKKSGF